jgi:tetratricopeptide (TPR) repeat protein
VDALLAHPDVTPRQRFRGAFIYANLPLAANNLRRYDDGIRLARRFIALVPSTTLEPSSFANGQSILANALRMRGDLEEAQVAIREAQATIGRGTDMSSQLNRYGLLAARRLILGEDGGVSLDRPDDAVVPLREAFTLMNAGAQADPNDATSGTRTATAARELGDILRWQRPADALAVYDVGLQRLAERTETASAKRSSAELLAGSAYALRRLGRTGEPLNV